MQILLVDLKTGIQSRESLVPLGLRKLYTYYTRQGYKVDYVTSDVFPDEDPDIICFSPIFLFKLDGDLERITAYRKAYPNALVRIGGVSVSLVPELFEQRLGHRNIEYVLGLQEDIEIIQPDYNFVSSKFSYGFTSRGCINKCSWCVVPKIEGKIRTLTHWRNQIGNHRRFLLMDNNLLACGTDHVEEVLTEFSEQGKIVDCNQGLDCVLFSKNIDAYYSSFEKYRDNINPIRFSWDSKRQDKYIQPTIEILNSLGKQASWYVLFGFNEDLEEIYHRCSVLLQNNQIIKLMRYKDIKTGEMIKDELGWYDKLANYINYRFISGMIAPRRTDVSILFPTDFSDFKKMLDIFNSFVKSIPSQDKRNAMRDDLFNMKRMLQEDKGEKFIPYVAPEKLTPTIDYDDDW